MKRYYLPKQLIQCTKCKVPQMYERAIEKGVTDENVELLLGQCENCGFDHTANDTAFRASDEHQNLVLEDDDDEPIASGIKQDLIEMLRAIQHIGLRESNVCDDEVENLLTDLASELGIRADEYMNDDEDDFEMKDGQYDIVHHGYRKRVNATFHENGTLSSLCDEDDNDWLDFARQEGVENPMKVDCYLEPI